MVPLIDLIVTAYGDLIGWTPRGPRPPLPVEERELNQRLISNFLRRSEEEQRLVAGELQWALELNEARCLELVREFCGNRDK